MAYQRDGEEPRRWAFCSLAQAEGLARTPAPFADGTFYRAKQFRLAARSALPLPDYLCVSRNHFDLEWTGERRLKNAVMVLEWIPDTSRLRTLPSKTGALSPAQEARLRKALSLLDLQVAPTY